LRYYRAFVYKKGSIDRIDKERKKEFELKEIDRFRYRTRYFTDSGIIGSKEFVSGMYKQFKGYFASKHKKKPKAVQGLEGVFSLKRLSENIWYKHKNKIPITRTGSLKIWTRPGLDILLSIFSLKKSLSQFKNRFPTRKNETKSYESYSIWPSIESLILWIMSKV